MFLRRSISILASMALGVLDRETGYRYRLAPSRVPLVLDLEDSTWTVSCATTAICAYALSEMSLLTRRQKADLQRILLTFRLNGPGDQDGAFPRTMLQTPSSWTTGQAALALANLGARWDSIHPSVEWLLKTQGTQGGWNFPGTDAGHEKLIYTFYPTLVLARFRRRLGKRGTQALARVSGFLDSCDERDAAWWIPLRQQLESVVATHTTRRPRTSHSGLTAYWQLFEEDWPTMHVDENWLPDRFSMAMMCGTNYLHLRHIVTPDDPLALLHIRYLLDERIEHGWNDKPEKHPKTWATALGALTLDRWASDLAGTNLTNVGTRAELLDKLRSKTRSDGLMTREARLLLRRLSELQAGIEHARRYQHWVRDVFTFVFGDVLKAPNLESRTSSGTLRRDITFRNTADTGVWADWKTRHHIDSVLIECKNTDTLTRDDIRQAATYMGKRMGTFAVLACRKTSLDDVFDQLSWFVNNDEKYLLVVNDENLTNWIRIKDRGENPTDELAELYRWLREGAQ